MGKFEPDWVIHPGELLLEEFTERESQGEPVDQSLFTEAELEGLFDGSLELSPDLADRVARTLGTSAQVWLNLEKIFREGLASGKTWLR